MKKKILSTILALSVCFTSGCENALKAVMNQVGAASLPKELYPPFFVVRDEKTGGVLYMLGTMHVGRADAVYPDEIYAAIDECSAAAFELDIDTLNANNKEVTDAMKLLECKNGTAKDYMGEDYNEIKKYFKRINLYSSDLEHYIPDVWSARFSNRMVAECGLDSEYGTDRVLTTYARKRGKMIISIETIAAQYKVNADTSPEYQTFVLKETIKDPEAQKQSLLLLYTEWAEGSDEFFKQIAEAESGVPDELKDDFEIYQREMYEERQRVMTDFAISRLQNGEKVFMAVGAMHYYASKNILELLEEAGCKPEKIEFSMAEAA